MSMGNDRIQQKLSKRKKQELNVRDYYWDSLLDQYDEEASGIEDTRGVIQESPNTLSILNYNNKQPPTIPSPCYLLQRDILT
jgi:hypothetical protein